MDGREELQLLVNRLPASRVECAIKTLEALCEAPPSEGSEFSSTRPVEEILGELASCIPREEWDALPRDLTDNLDHYLYGIPRR